MIKLDERKLLHFDHAPGRGQHACDMNADARPVCASYTC